METNEKKNRDIELQRLYTDLQILSEQIGELQRQSEEISSRIAEITSAISAIGELAEAKNSEEALIPITGGIYARGRITDAENLVMNVGAGVMVEKKAQDVIKILEERLSELKGYNEQLISQIEQLNSAAVNSETELRKLLHETMKKEKE
ncbi:MAG: prefoldin subunit alpha [Candidatus Woesearchaeota archaeon]